MATVVAHWNYEDDSQCGPCNWPNAQNGKQQSPIDLKLSKMKVYQLGDCLKFVNYHKPLNGELINNGHSGKCFDTLGYRLLSLIQVLSEFH